MGKLRATHVMRSDAFKGVGLAFLAACSSGRFFQPKRTFKEYLGMDVVFLAAGVRSTVATLWDVNDLVTLILVADFYEHLRNQRSVRSSLSRAVNSLRMGSFRDRDSALDRVYPKWRDELRSAAIDTSDPHYWGAYKCSGWTSMPIGQPGDVRSV
jgi:CHAT domain-containing protein